MVDNITSYSYDIMYYFTLHGLTAFFSVLQRDWVNEYHRQCREVVGAELERQGRKDALEWLIRETQPIVWRLTQSDLFSQEYWTTDCSAVIIVCIFLIILCVSRSASFVKHIVSAVLLKIINTIEKEPCCVY